jgi:RimJ/RimL family protein N-acetyltransferase
VSDEGLSFPFCGCWLGAHRRANSVRRQPWAKVGITGVLRSFTMGGGREVTYWIDPSRWGHGLATRALQAFVEIEATRPLFARVAEHNIGSAKVLARVGFAQIGSAASYADGVGREVVEHIYCLTSQRHSPPRGDGHA